jgi:hypothetical protein
MVFRVTTYSVADASETKSYLWLVADHGVEMGFGAAGEYEAHAHKHFVDVIFAPSGLQLSRTHDRANLLIVPPRIRFGPVVSDAFFFMKLLPDGAPFEIPEKVIGTDLDAYPDGVGIDQLTIPFELSMSYFDPRDGSDRVVEFHANDGELRVASTAGWDLTILP